MSGLAGGEIRHSAMLLGIAALSGIAGGPAFVCPCAQHVGPPASRGESEVPPEEMERLRFY